MADIYLSGYLDRRKCWSYAKLKFSPQLDQVRKFAFQVVEYESYLSFLCHKTPGHVIVIFRKTVTIENPILRNVGMRQKFRP